jgi:hypothetical protein
MARKLSENQQFTPHAEYECITLIEYEIIVASGTLFKCRPVHSALSVAKKAEAGPPDQDWGGIGDRAAGEKKPEQAKTA